MTSTSLCTVLPISIKRRQTFSRNEITLSTSASLGSLSSGSPGFAPDGPETPGTGSPRAKSSFFRLVFSPCRRAISVSSAERSSGTTLQAPADIAPAALRDLAGAGVEPQHAVGHRIDAVAAVLAIGRRRLRRCDGADKLAAGVHYPPNEHRFGVVIATHSCCGGR